MIELFDQGCQLALPVVVAKKQPLIFRAWRPDDPLDAGVFGTLHPSPRCEVVEPDALIVPLLACDEEGWRLGYGGGFYDRTLGACAPEKGSPRSGLASTRRSCPTCRTVRTISGSIGC